MSCLTALDSQITTLLSTPQEILLLQHKVFREYAKVAIGPDFIHTLPSFLILISVAIILWRNPPASNGLAHVVASTLLYRFLQLLVSWVFVITTLWVWLMLQRFLYCYVWTSWNYESEYLDFTYQWWQRVWSSYYSSPLEPPPISAGLISWIVSMTIAVTTLACAVSVNALRHIVWKSLTRAEGALKLAKCYATFYFIRILTSILRSYWPEEAILAAGKINTVPIMESEDSSICDEYRSEVSNNLSNPSPKEIHPISYGTNWLPRPSFIGYRDAQKKGSTKSLHTVAVVNDIQDSDETSPRQLRYKRGCHTVVPSNHSDQSAGC